MGKINMRDAIINQVPEAVKIPRGMSVLDTQVGGSHYNKMKIQPVTFILENSISYLEGNAIKYICRHSSKNGEEDIDKAIQYLKMIKEFTYGGD